MMYNNQQQLHQFEEEMFHTALLGLLEIEGRRLMLENEHLKKEETCALPPAGGVRGIERMLRQVERGRRMQAITKKISPIVSKVAVWFLVIFIGTSTAIIASAYIREVVYQLLFKHHERYTQIKPNVSTPDISDYLAAGAEFVPTYIPEQLQFDRIESGKYSMTASYVGKEDPELYLDFQQMTPIENAQIKIDSEGADRIEDVMIGNSQGLLIVEGEQTILTWRNETQIFLIFTNLAPEEAIRFAEGVREVQSQ